jgi:hypothetical protein
MSCSELSHHREATTSPPGTPSIEREAAAKPLLPTPRAAPRPATTSSHHHGARGKKVPLPPTLTGLRLAAPSSGGCEREVRLGGEEEAAQRSP